MQNELAKIISDYVAMKSGLRKAKFAVVCRQEVHGMVRQKNHAFVIIAFYDFIGYEVVHR